MTNHELIKNSFESVAPSEELLKKTLSQNTEKSRKKIHVKRALTAVFAACAVLALGITAAAAGGYIDFEAVFGDYIKVPNSELAASMIGNVSDFRYKVSDKNYRFTVKGAVGDERNAMFIIELSRTDGTPVTEHFNFDTDETRLLQSIHDDFEVRTAFDTLSGSFGHGYRINEAGNIEIDLQGSSRESINGKIFKARGENFYPDEPYFNKMNEENVYYGLNDGKWGYYHKYTNTPADFDDSPFILLELKWDISFRYKASEDSKRLLTCKDLSQDFIYSQDIHEGYGKENYDGSITYYPKPELFATAENIAKPGLIEIGTLNGRLIFDYKPNEYEIADNNNIRHYYTAENNEMYIIYKDGTRIIVKSNSTSGSMSDENSHVEANLRYYTDDYSVTFIELDKVKAFFINGVTYELSE